MSSGNLRLRGNRSQYVFDSCIGHCLGCKWLAVTLGESLIHVILYSILLLENSLQSGKVHP